MNCINHLLKLFFINIQEVIQYGDSELNASVILA